MKFSRPSSLRNITRRLAAVCRNNNHKPRTLRTRAEKSLAMSWMCSSDTNAGLIENMYKNGLIEDIRIKDAFLKVRTDTLHSPLRNGNVDNECDV